MAFYYNFDYDGALAVQSIVDCGCFFFQIRYSILVLNLLLALYLVYTVLIKIISPNDTSLSEP